MTLEEFCALCAADPSIAAADIAAYETAYLHEASSPLAGEEWPLDRTLGDWIVDLSSWHAITALAGTVDPDELRQWYVKLMTTPTPGANAA